MKEKGLLEYFKNIKQHVDLEIDFNNKRVIGITKLYFQIITETNTDSSQPNPTSSLHTITNEMLSESIILKLNSENSVIKSVKLQSIQSLKFNYIPPNSASDYLKSLYNTIDDPESIRNINRVIIYRF